MTLMGKLMTGAGVLALSTGFAAAAPAVVQNDLNLRSGPGIEYPVVAAMPSGATVDVMGCEAGWCRVGFNGTVGWASRAYMGLGGGVAVAPAYRGYGEGYVVGGIAPRYGYAADTYAYGGYGPRYNTYGYYGSTGYRGSVGVSEGRTFSSERRFGDQSAVRSERRSSATTSAGVSGGARAETQSAADVKGNNPMKAEKSTAPVANARSSGEIQGNNPMKGGSSNAAATERRGTAQAGATRGNARATTGAAPRENRY